MRRVLSSCSGAAAAEMALVAPLLVALMFGSMELGFYFYSEHVVVKAVRDGARFGSREGFSNFDCSDASAGTINSGAMQDIQRVTRTNQVASGGSARIANWTDDASVAVTVRCVTSADYGSFYQGLADADGNQVIPVVVVTATVAYIPLFNSLGFSSSALQLTAKSEAPVMGI